MFNLKIFVRIVGLILFVIGLGWLGYIADTWMDNFQHEKYQEELCKK